MDELQKALESFPEVTLAVLFGSHAEGKASPKSDVDIAVEFSSSDPTFYPRLRDALSHATHRWVDLIDVKNAPPLLRMEIVRHGKVIIERTDDAWVRFKTKAMLDWGDWAPAARWLAAQAIQKNREKVRRWSNTT